MSASKLSQGDDVTMTYSGGFEEIDDIVDELDDEVADLKGMDSMTYKNISKTAKMRSSK